jgi:hypothetical protein
LHDKRPQSGPLAGAKHIWVGPGLPNPGIGRIKPCLAKETHDCAALGQELGVHVWTPQGQPPMPGSARHRDLVSPSDGQLQGPIAGSPANRRNIAAEQGGIEESAPDNHRMPDSPEDGATLSGTLVEDLEPGLPDHAGPIPQRRTDPGH